MRLLTTLPTLVISQQFDNTFLQNRNYVTLNGPILPDKTIRPIGSENCAWKKMGKNKKYTPGDPVWQTKCYPGSTEYHWSYDENTGLVKSLGSGNSRPMCWWVKKDSKEEHQRVRIMDCDASDLNQQFSWELGRFVSKANTNLCVGFDVKRRRGPLMTTKCFHNTFYHLYTDGDNLAYTTPFTTDDQSIRPIGFDMCADSEHASLQDGGNLWLKACQSDYVTLGIARPSTRSASSYSTQKWMFQPVIPGNSKGRIITTQNQTDFCWAVYPTSSSPNVLNLDETIVTKICDDNDDAQHWKYQGDSWSNPPTPVGLLRSAKYSNYCVGLDYAQIESPEALIYLSHCHSSMFGDFQMPDCPIGHKLNQFAECELLDDTPCGMYPCKNNAVCQNKNATTYECFCSPGYSGETCEQENICTLDNPCENGAICHSETNSTEYHCYCPPQHTGQNCEIVEPCALHPCQNSGICANLDSVNYQCFCPPFATGENCETLTPPCSFNPCENNGVCQDSEDLFSYSCFCPPTHAGDNCETERLCFNNPCQNSGVCVDLEDDYHCYCPPNVIGRNCRNVLPCSNPDKCKNGGICANLDEGGFLCFCAPGFTGVKCGNTI